MVKTTNHSDFVPGAFEAVWGRPAEPWTMEIGAKQQGQLWRFSGATGWISPRFHQQRW
jgi:hypothetical protein